MPSPFIIGSGLQSVTNPPHLLLNKVLNTRGATFVAYVDSSTVVSQATVISVDRGPFTEPGTVGSVTTVIVDSAESYMHPSGFWGPFDTDDGII